MTVQMIRYSDLVVSPRNVRKRKEGIDTLAASIGTEGLLQNLVVIPIEGGKFEVIAGERRRRAIGKLVKAKTWARDVEVPCIIRTGSEATGISLIENTERKAMHPADAYRAFAKLQSEGYDETAIANRYNYDPREVRKLLALGNLSPKVLNALAADKIDVATARAFTLTDDHKRQDAVLRKASTAHDVRRLMTDAKASTTSRQFRFIGAEAYEEAGGTYTRDLFAKDGEGYANDAELLADMVDVKLETLAAEARADGWGTVIAAQQTPHESYQWHRIYPREQIGLAPEAVAELDALNAQIDALMEGMDEDFDPEDDPEIAELSLRRDEIEAAAAFTFSAEAKASGILVITIDHAGEADATAYSKRLPSSGSSGPKPPRALYDQKMTEDLSKVCTSALQVEVFENPALARCVLIDALLPIVAETYMIPAHAVLLRAADRLQGETGFDINLTEILSVQDRMASTLAQVPEDAAERFDWLLAQDDAMLERLQAYCTAALIDATTPKFASADRIASANRIARASGLDMAKHWDGGIDFYSRLSRKAILAALTEACGADAAQNCEKMKKDALAQAAVERISGRGWLPPALRTPADAGEALDDPAPDADEADAGDHAENLADGDFAQAA